MPEDLKTVADRLFSAAALHSGGLHSPGVRKHCQIIFACYFRKYSILWPQYAHILTGASSPSRHRPRHPPRHLTQRTSIAQDGKCVTGFASSSGPSFAAAAYLSILRRFHCLFGVLIRSCRACAAAASAFTSPKESVLLVLFLPTGSPCTVASANHKRSVFLYIKKSIKKSERSVLNKTRSKHIKVQKNAVY